MSYHPHDDIPIGVCGFEEMAEKDIFPVIEWLGETNAAKMLTLIIHEMRRAEKSDTDDKRAFFDRWSIHIDAVIAKWAQAEAHAEQQNADTKRSYDAMNARFYVTR
jgi:hypothetical protein